MQTLLTALGADRLAGDGRSARLASDRATPDGPLRAPVGGWRGVRQVRLWAGGSGRVWGAVRVLTRSPDCGILPGPGTRALRALRNAARLGRCDGA